MGPELRVVLVGDDPSAWAAAGFSVEGADVCVGTVRVRLTGTEGPRGVHGWALAGAEAGSIDGLATFSSDLGPATPSRHRNGARRVDHVVARTPDLDRTVTALHRFGLEARRRREVPGSAPPAAQVFFWAGEAILELVGPAEPSGSGPARFWGLAMSCDDLEQAASELGDRLGPIKPAVQPGRRIATVRGAELDLSVPLALMSPHPPD